MKKGMIAVLSTMVGAAIGAGVEGKIESTETRRQKGLAGKHLNLYLLMNQWVRVKQENKSMAEYLEKQGYKEIAIYGMHYVGETLLNELAETDIKIKYGIDKAAGSIYADIDVVSPEDELEPVDAIIVTAITFFDEIEEQLSEKIPCPIISLEDILYEM